MLVRPALRDYQTWTSDSRYWDLYRPRARDVIIATQPKSGTTWMQQIVGSLIFRTAAPRSLPAISPWMEACFRHKPEDVHAMIEAQSHRRFLKTHLPLDGLPLFDEVFYIHVARDGRDVAMSLHNHLTGFSADMLQTLDRVGLANPSIAEPFPRVPEEPAAYFRWWLTNAIIPGQNDGGTSPSYFESEQGFWAERKRANLLMVHYNDLITQREVEMRRVAAFLGIDIPGDIWPDIVRAASFTEMQRTGDVLMPQTKTMFTEGSARFFNKGKSGQWRSFLSEDDTLLYETKVNEYFSSPLAAWLENGRAVTGDPCDC